MTPAAMTSSTPTVEPKAPLSSAGGSRGRIQTLDGLRGVAILLVICGHSFGDYPLSSDSPWRHIIPFVANAGLGVRIFFTLSGYLITSILLRERGKTGRIDLRLFYARRVLRIFPAFYSYLIAVAILTLIGLLKVSKVELLSAAAFAWNYSVLWTRFPSPDGWWFVGHFWTLALEEQFYLFWPCLLAILGPVRVRPWIVGILAASPLLRVISYFAFPSTRAQIGIMFHTSADLMLAGAAVALIEYSRANRPRWRPQNWMLVASILFVVVISPLIRLALQPKSGRYDLPVGLALDALGVALWLIYLRSSDGADFFSRCLAWKPLVWIGRISYSWYLWQQLFLGPKGVSLHWPFPFGILLGLAAAVVSHYIIEKPFLALKDRRFSSSS